MLSISSTNSYSYPDPRPVMTQPSTAATQTPSKPTATTDESRGDHRVAHHHEHHGRAHGQQDLHGITREVRHAIRSALGSSDLNAETAQAVKDLQDTFKSDLHDVFHDARDGDGVNRDKVLAGLASALQSLTDGLRALMAPGDETTPRTDPAPSKTSQPAETSGVIVDVTA